PMRSPLRFVTRTGSVVTARASRMRSARHEGFPRRARVSALTVATEQHRARLARRDTASACATVEERNGDADQGGSRPRPKKRDEMNPNQALWEKGDFTRIADTMRESGEALVQKLGVTRGLKVLDLGCGDGTTAFPEARLGADVLGVDIAINLVEAGNRRAKQLGLANCRFQQGDASNLHELADRSFDLVVSIFGAMFAPKPFDVAKEMVRVTRPGGRIVMGNWIPNDPTLVAQILK